MAWFRKSSNKEGLDKAAVPPGALMQLNKVNPDLVRTIVAQGIRWSHGDRDYTVKSVTNEGVKVHCHRTREDRVLGEGESLFADMHVALNILCSLVPIVASKPPGDKVKAVSEGAGSPTKERDVLYDKVATVANRLLKLQGDIDSILPKSRNTIVAWIQDNSRSLRESIDRHEDELTAILDLLKKLNPPEGEVESASESESRIALLESTAQQLHEDLAKVATVANRLPKLQEDIDSILPNSRNTIVAWIHDNNRSLRESIDRHEDELAAILDLLKKANPPEGEVESASESESRIALLESAGQQLHEDLAAERSANSSRLASLGASVHSISNSLASQKSSAASETNELREKVVALASGLKHATMQIDDHERRILRLEQLLMRAPTASAGPRATPIPRSLREWTESVEHGTSEFWPEALVNLSNPCYLDMEEYSPLSILGYRVGRQTLDIKRAEYWTREQRHQFLRSFWESSLPAFLPEEYHQAWGKAQTKERAAKIQSHLTGLINRNGRISKSMETSVAHWREDIQFVQTLFSKTKG